MIRDLAEAAHDPRILADLRHIRCLGVDSLAMLLRYRSFVSNRFLARLERSDRVARAPIYSRALGDLLDLWRNMKRPKRRTIWDSPDRLLDTWSRWFATVSLGRAQWIAGLRFPRPPVREVRGVIEHIGDGGALLSEAVAMGGSCVLDYVEAILRKECWLFRVGGNFGVERCTVEVSAASEREQPEYEIVQVAGRGNALVGSKTLLALRSWAEQEPNLSMAVPTPEKQPTQQMLFFTDSGRGLPLFA